MTRKFKWLPAQRLARWMALGMVLLTVLCLAPGTAALADETEAATTSQNTSENTALQLTEDENAAAAIRMKNGKAILYNPTTGKKYTGLKGVQEVPASSGFYYLFRSKKGIVYNTGFVTYKKKTYYAQPSGQLLSGLWEINGKTYYFHPTNFRLCTGWRKIDGSYRYFSKKTGEMVTGWMKLNGKTYYLDPNNNGIRAKGLTVIDGKTYFFNGKAVLRTGLIKTSGAAYYAGSSGVIQTGLIKTSNGTYFADSNGVLKTGWVKMSSSVSYYFSPSNYKAYTGKHQIDGTYYYFNSDGTMNTNPTGAWSIRVNQSTCCVTVYRGDTPVKSFACSVGLNGATPDGTFYIRDHLRWHELMGPCWGQWCSHITDDILFHSIPYNAQNDKYSMSVTAYNKLGYSASHGCIRLAAINAKYIYDNCPVGTKVTIFHGTSADDPLGKPATPYAPYWTKTYDPTDPTIG